MQSQACLVSQGGSEMDRSRSASRDGNERTMQYKSQQEMRLDTELVEQKLTQLLAFVGQLQRTPTGIIEIERRVKLFGECKRTNSETSTAFYGRLRHWIDRDIPQTKSPLHPPRQT
jgi:hypothetical protein